MKRLSKRGRNLLALMLAAFMVLGTAFSAMPVNADAGTNESRAAMINAEWEFEEGEGTSVSDTTGTYVGTIQGEVSWVDGIKGKALDFNRKGYVDLSLGSLEGDWTIAFWLNKGSNNLHTAAVLFGGVNGEIKLEQWKNTKKLGISIPGVVDASYDYILPENEWKHLAFVGTSSGVTLYVDGQEEGTISRTITCPLQRIGSPKDEAVDYAGNMDATMDELKVFNSALSAKEIEAIYNGTELVTEKETLKAEIDKVHALVKDDYTERSWAALEEALQRANDVYADDGASQGTINAAYFALVAAREGLIEVLGTNKINIASFNIAANRKPDIAAISNLMEEKKITVAGVQEIDVFTSRNNYDMMQRFLDQGYFGYSGFQKAIDFGGGQYGIGILSQYELNDVGGASLPSRTGIEGRAYSRGVFEKDGKKIALYSTHLSYEDRAIRDQQVKTIIDIMNADPTPYKILTGDFNTGDTNKEFYPFMRDYHTANGKDGVWLHTINNESAEGELQQIDNIITTNNIKINHVYTVDAGLSDHYMLYAECELLEEEVPSRQLLNFKLEEAESLQEESYTPDSYVALSKAIDAAKGLAENASQEEINAVVDLLYEAIANLRTSIIKPLEAKAGSTYNLSNQNPNNVINNSGMSGSDSMQDQHDNHPSARTMWHTANNPGANAWIQVDLGKEYKLDEMWIWNMNQQNYADRGLKNVKIEYSLDETSWKELKPEEDMEFAEASVEGYPFQFAKASGASLVSVTNLNDSQHSPVCFHGETARYVRITAAPTPGEGTWGSTYYGLSELRFTECLDTQKTELQALYDQYSSLDGTGYTTESWKNFKTALDAAKVVLENETATEQEVDEAITALQSAIDNLRVNKSLLEVYLNEAKQHVAAGEVDGLVESVRKLFADAIAHGEAVMAKENATWKEVDNATTKLMLAIHALGMKAGDKTDLAMALEIAEMIDLEQYVEAGQDAYQAALNEAQIVLKDGDAFQEDVDAAWEALVDAMGNLRLKANKDVLEELLKSVEGLDMNLYTEESVQTFQTALANAKAVMANAALSEDDQKVVDDAVKALADAKEGLEKKEADENKTDKDSTNSGKDDTAGSKKNNSAAPKTGDNTSLMFMLMLACISGAVILVNKRKEENM